MDKIKEIILQIEALKTEQKFEQCKEVLEKAILEYSADYRLYEELADVYLYKWELEKLMKAIDFAISLNKDSATWNYLKWFLLLSKDKIEESISFLEKSNSLMKNNSEVLRNLWWAYTMTGNSHKGILILKRALNINPNDELITEDLAMALIWNGDISEWNNLLQKIGKEIVA